MAQWERSDAGRGDIKRRRSGHLERYGPWAVMEKALLLNVRDGKLL
jgi:hypothetical protein